MARRQRTYTTIEQTFGAVIIFLLFGHTANAAIINIDQCRVAVNDIAKTLSTQARVEDAKTEIFHAWNACKAEDFETADAKLKAAKALIMGAK